MDNAVVMWRRIVALVVAYNLAPQVAENWSVRERTD
jgi:hypothetical protein